VIKEHYDAVKALLPVTVNVHMWRVPKDAAYPYVCLWGGLGDESSGGPDGESLQDVPDSLSLRVRATYAGLNGDSTMILCRNVRAALSRKTPVVAGWRTNPLRQSALMDAQADLSITLTDGSNPVYAVDEFALVSDKL
jgi:hypothetical protein